MLHGHLVKEIFEPHLITIPTSRASLINNERLIGLAYACNILWLYLFFWRKPRLLFSYMHYLSLIIYIIDIERDIYRGPIERSNKHDIFTSDLPNETKKKVHWLPNWAKNLRVGVKSSRFLGPELEWIWKKSWFIFFYNEVPFKNALLLLRSHYFLFYFFLLILSLVTTAPLFFSPSALWYIINNKHIIFHRIKCTFKH